MTSSASPAPPLGSDGAVVVVGGGPAGATMALYLAHQGYQVQVLESRQDLRRHDVDAGRSINLALARRGIVPLTELGVFDQVEPITIPMAGRIVHATDGSTNFQPYGLDGDDAILSVSRPGLNAILLDAAEETGNVSIEFGQRCRGVDWDEKLIVFTDSGNDDQMTQVPFGTVFGCDGANSEIRQAMQRVNGGTTTIEQLDHGYKELEIPAGPDGSFQLDPGGLHIWPRGQLMLIALANPGGDFTVTLFMPYETPDGKDQPTGFDDLEDQAAAEAFFAREFPDFVELVPDAGEQFMANPTGDLGTVRCTGWSRGGDGVILGDAAHAIVPFHGQGMNAAMESARLLSRRIAESGDDPDHAFTLFEMDRKPDVDAIADMALDNYIEMRAGVADPDYLIKRELALELERRFPEVMAARYGMVMFTTMPYHEVQERSAEQQRILTDLVAGAGSIDDIDFDRARELLTELGPLPAEV
ncbi:MAG: FAD-dependent monooxygenase [Acidimicrobiia bacterium]|nr:FAD-dependent monooxygenase [Acidimicrobiia bacterium]